MYFSNHYNIQPNYPVKYDVRTDMLAQPITYQQPIFYQPQLYDVKKSYTTETQVVELPVHQPFLRSNRPLVRFVGKADEIIDEIHEAFYKTTGYELPQDIMVQVVDEMTLKSYKIYQLGLLGFALNTKPWRMVYVKENPLDMLFLTLGHELGHVWTEQALTRVDEEAKAFAFEFAWARTVYKEDILGLAANIDFAQPAKNGLHDKAFEFVRKQIMLGKDPLELYHEIAKGDVSVARSIEWFI